MKIAKILNNNALIAAKEDGSEIIAMGKGLAFKARIGQEVDPARIERTFVLDVKAEDSRFASLLSEIELDEFEFVDSLVQKARMEIGEKLGNVIYVTLLDHINNAKIRAEQGIYLSSSMLWDMKRLYKEEFKAGMEMVKAMNEKFNASFDEHEAAALAIHLVGAQSNAGLGSVMKTARMVSDMLNLVKYHFAIALDEESISCHRFVTHLQFLAQRLLNDRTHSDEDHDLYDLVVARYPEAFAAAVKLQDYLLEKHGYACTGEEAMYLTVHIAKVVRENAQQ